MRKLLITSQKGGVGKTTTAVNLAHIAAQAGQRVLLVDADPLGSVVAALGLQSQVEQQRASGRPNAWSFWRGTSAGADVLAPLHPADVSDQNLEQLLKQLTSREFAERSGPYDLLVFDSPPYLGARPRLLLEVCDEWVLVIRAEPLAYRTLPGFLSRVNEVRQEDSIGQLRGILLTLPPEPNNPGRWETRIRALLGARVLPQTIPFDPEAAGAMHVGRPITAVCADAPAARQYRALAQYLGLTGPEAPPNPTQASRDLGPVVRSV